MLKGPDFWRRSAPGPLARFLSPLSLLFGEIAVRRMKRMGAHPAAPVVAVGSMIVGGAGKTLTALAVARLLMAHGEQPAFVARGHGGRIAVGGSPMRVAGQRASDVGDEPLLLARTAPTFVGVDEAAAAVFAVDETTPSIIILDDGFFKRRLEPDVAIAVVEGAVGVGNGLCVPAGPLLAPLSALLERASAVVVIGEGDPGEKVAAAARAAGRAVLLATLDTDSRARALAGRAIVAFAGIRSNDEFFATLRQLGARIVAQRPYPDRYQYEADDMKILVELARDNDALLVTTELDALRLPPLPAGAPMSLAVPVSIRFDDEAQAAKVLLDTLIRVMPWRNPIP